MAVAEVVAGPADTSGNIRTCAFEEAEVGRVQRHRVVEVDDVLHLQLPVCPGGVELRALDNLHAFRALIGEIVEVRTRVAKVGREVGSVGVEADEHEAAVVLEAWDLFEVEVLAPQSAGVARPPPARCGTSPVFLKVHEW